MSYILESFNHGLGPTANNCEWYGMFSENGTFYEDLRVSIFKVIQKQVFCFSKTEKHL